jgi:hypothetical protein
MSGIWEGSVLMAVPAVVLGSIHPLIGIGFFVIACLFWAIMYVVVSRDMKRQEAEDRARAESRRVARCANRARTMARREALRPRNGEPMTKEYRDANREMMDAWSW